METIKLDDLRLAVSALQRERDTAGSMAITMQEAGYDRPAISLTAVSARLDAAADNLAKILEDIECRGEKYVGIEV